MCLRPIVTLVGIMFGLQSMVQGLSKWTDVAEVETVMSLKKWQKGIAVESRLEEEACMYLYFYEHNLFHAVKMGERSEGSFKWEWKLSHDGTKAVMTSTAMSMFAQAVADGAELTLEITNIAIHDWPECAAIIPCFNPGPSEVRNPLFADAEHRNTYFVGTEGLELLKKREIHFNEDILPAIESWSKERDDGTFVFSQRWPTSEKHATAGIMIRESEDKKWVMGIAWESFLSAQGHNPWMCMHLSVKVGPLKQGEKKKIRGKIYLFKGAKEDCLEHFRRDFPARDPEQ